MSGSKTRGWALPVALAALVVLVAAALASATARPAHAATAPPEISPASPDADAVNRAVPNSRSAAHVPSSHVPRPAGSSVAGAGSAAGFGGLTMADERNADGGNQFSVEPPDQGLCVGNGQVIDAVNVAFSVYTTGGTQTSGPTSLTTFFTGQHAIDRTTGVYGPFLSDPKCYYDPQLGRFFLTVLEISTDPATGAFTDRSHELIAVSKSSTATTDPGDWFTYAIDTTDDGSAADDGSGRILPQHPGCPCFGDQPLIGADAYGFYVTTNEFSIDGPEFDGAQIYAVDKAALASGTLRYQAIQGEPIPLAEGPAYSLQPATSPTAGDWSTANGGTEYLLSALDFDATLDDRIAVWALTNTQSLASASPDVSLASTVVGSEVYGQPPDAAQKKGPTPLADSVNAHEELIAGNDDRMNQAVYAGGTLYGALNTVVKAQNGPTRIGIAYFVVSPSASGGAVQASIANQGYVAVNNESVLYPSIAVNSAGEGAMAFSLVGPDYYPSSAYTGFSTAGAGGVVHVVGPGAAPDDGFSGYGAYGGNGTGRWGDYSAAVPDADGSIWLASEWIPGTFGYPPYLANWGTFISHVTP